jgi:hypothetical protein
MMGRRKIAVVLLALTLTGWATLSCATLFPGSDSPPGEIPPPDVSPLEWLAQAAFEAGGGGQPDIVPANLPEGFHALETMHSIDEFGAGFSAYHSTVGFERPIGDGGTHFVGVVLIAHDVPEGRTYHLDSYAEGEYTWEFLELEGHQIARYYSSRVDARAWISGPYIVEVYGPFHTTGLNPWVDTFASLFLAMFPPN